ncbi:MAG: hypothetical protein GY845_27280 [Planctomycetes bacterium]|nr:hypothetical protein [Planctomycetota bacterium]
MEKDKDTIAYDKKILAFIDILGFEDLVRRSKDHPKRIMVAYDWLESTRKTARKLRDIEAQPSGINVSEYVYHIFSDTVTASCPCKSSDYIDFMTAWIMQYQYRMWARKGAFLRGSIVLGDIWEDKEMIFGPALITAYHLENDSDGAVWPRIIVDESILQVMTEDQRAEAFLTHMRRDERGYVFLDYLKHLFRVYTDIQMTGKFARVSNPIRILQDHRDRITKEIRRTKRRRDLDAKQKESILSKYGHLIAYHNLVVDEKTVAIDSLINHPTKVNDIVSSITYGGLSDEGFLPLRGLPYSLRDHEFFEAFTVLGVASKSALDEAKNWPIDDVDGFIDFVSRRSYEQLGVIREEILETRMKEISNT